VIHYTDYTINLSSTLLNYKIYYYPKSVTHFISTSVQTYDSEDCLTSLHFF